MAGLSVSLRGSRPLEGEKAAKGGFDDGLDPRLHAESVASGQEVIVHSPRRNGENVAYIRGTLAVANPAQAFDLPRRQSDGGTGRIGDPGPDKSIVAGQEVDRRALIGARQRDMVPCERDGERTASPPMHGYDVAVVHGEIAKLIEHLSLGSRKGAALELPPRTRGCGRRPYDRTVRRQSGRHVVPDRRGVDVAEQGFNALGAAVVFDLDGDDHLEPEGPEFRHSGRVELPQGAGVLRDRYDIKRAPSEVRLPAQLRIRLYRNG